MKQREDLIYPELSYKIVGILYEVHNQLGGGLREKSYEQALLTALSGAGLSTDCQRLAHLKFGGQVVAKRFIDMVVDNKIIIELKTGDRFSSEHIRQISEYLKETGMRLGLLVNFGKERVSVKRIVNEY